MRTIPPHIYSEKVIQKAVANWCIQKGHSHVVPNCGVFGWEADLLSVTAGLFMHEYEIKISKSDFRADKHKTHKHRHFQHPGISKYYQQPSTPAHFWYVCPAELAKQILSEIPVHAGLIALIDYRDKFNNISYFMQVLKKAPRLHDIQASDRQLSYISRGLMLRYWGQPERLDEN